MGEGGRLDKLDEITSKHRGDPDFMLSLARGLQVLLAFSDKSLPSSTADIARRTGLDRAVARRCIHTLECLGMLSREGKRFILGVNVLNLGHAYFSSIDVVQRAQPLLDTLGDAVHTNCALAMLNRGDVVYLVRSQSRRLTKQSLGMGSRLPAHCTSLGRVLLAQLDQAALDAYFHVTHRPLITPYTVTDEALLRSLLKQVEASGFAIVNQEVGMDLIGIAVPVKIKNFEPQLALSVTVSTRSTAPEDMKNRYLAKMLDTASKLGAF